jgi:hypothetical protein
MPGACKLSEIPLFLDEGEQPTIIEPVPKAVEAILDQVFCRSKIEPWIDW